MLLSGVLAIDRMALALVLFLVLSGCNPADNRPGITVAAAANLSDAFNEIAAEFQRKTGLRVVYSYASTAQLSQQIENAAPFDVFAAADTAHVDHLIRMGKLTRESRAVYARGRLALWIPKTNTPRLEDLSTPAVRFISVANPKVAPYGQAAIEALKAAGLWEDVKSKIVYAGNIQMARSHVASGNADAAFTALSLVLNETASVLQVDETLHLPLDQALGVVASSGRKHEANQFRSFLLGPSGKTILARYGYTFPVAN